MMDESIREHVAQYCRTKGWKPNDATIIEAIREAKRLHREEVGQHRWWNDYLYVVEVDGMIIGYLDSETTGDRSAWEVGCEFDPTTICRMRAVEKTVITYEDIV